MRYFLNDVVEKVFQSLAPSGPIAFQVVCEDVYLANNHALAIGMIALTSRAFIDRLCGRHVRS
ncbi:hypothetical protein [Bradyrhizobium zhanjiangense]|nr:hypothetical protein [Bradyrhizobium zhanjiangense]